MTVGRGADGCASVPRDPLGIPTEAIPAGKRDSGATGKENAITASKSASHPLEDFDALAQPSNPRASGNTQRTHHEDRRHRRQLTHRIETRHQAPRTVVFDVTGVT